MSDGLDRQENLPRQLAVVRQRKLEATQSLLGGTIAIDDLDWQRASLLPGWTRAHVASHLARNADAFLRVMGGLTSGLPIRMYGSDLERQRDIERGSERSALELQIDLDTSAGLLNAAFDALDSIPGDTPVELTSGRWVRADLLPMARLNEVVLHHLDLDCGFGWQQLDPDIARWLLEWNAYWIADRPDFPALNIDSNSGFSTRLGGRGVPVSVGGDDNLLLGWLTSRLTADEVSDRGLPLLPA